MTSRRGQAKRNFTGQYPVDLLDEVKAMQAVLAEERGVSYVSMADVVRVALEEFIARRRGPSNRPD